MRAEVIARALGGRRVGSTWMARCPAHDDRTPSLAIREASDGTVLLRCHAGCGQAEVIGSLRSRGLWTAHGAGASDGVRGTARESRAPAADEVADRRVEAARRLWRASVPAEGSVVESYLRVRGIVAPVPPSLRFHPGLRHPSGGRWPGMVALVTGGRDAAFRAVHRTFLNRDGSAKAPVEPQRMMLGACCGGAVRLGRAGEDLMVGEGIETCLAAAQATGRVVWAALSTAGLRALDLPAKVCNVTVLADGDAPGEAAAEAAARRWSGEGRRVFVARPGIGLDFNDLLFDRTTSGAECSA